MTYLKILIYVLATFLATSTLVFAHDDDDDEEEVEIPLEEAELFFELNDTDGDLGIHGFADGDAWKELEIEGPNGRELMEIDVKSKLKRQGVTELFFESAEPCFRFDAEECQKPLDPAKFFKRFPEGVYKIEVELLDGDELESEVYLSHVMPAAPGPDGTKVNNVDAAVNCDADLKIVDPAGGVTISWDAVTMSHATLPPGSAIVDIADDVRYYEVVVEIDESDFNQTAIIPPAEDGEDNEWTFSEDFFELAEEGVLESDDEVECEGPVNGDKCFAEYKYEILVRVNNKDDNPGNKSAMESCFLVEIK